MACDMSALFLRFYYFCKFENLLLKINYYNNYYFCNALYFRCHIIIMFYNRTHFDFRNS